MTGLGEWSDSNNERQTYFDGANYGKKICRCGNLSPNRCIESPDEGHINYCNCDQKDPVDRIDWGYITNMVSKIIAPYWPGARNEHL